MDLHLIDDELNLDKLIDDIISRKNLSDYKVIKFNYSKNSILGNLFIKISNKFDKNAISECLTLRASISVILNYEVIGC